MIRWNGIMIWTGRQKSAFSNTVFCIENRRLWILHNVFADMSDASDFCTLNLQKITVCPVYTKISERAHKKRDEFSASPIWPVHPEKVSFIYAKFLCSFQNWFVYVQNQPELNLTLYIERAKGLSFHVWIACSCGCYPKSKIALKNQVNQNDCCVK